jgi:hypothetical protein
MGEWELALAKSVCNCRSAVLQTMACHINITLLIEHSIGEGNRKILQAQEVKEGNKPGVE